MTYDFFYYVRANKHSVSIDIGYFDPDRFEGSGGHRFATTSQLYISDKNWGVGDPEWEIQVMQQGNSFVSIEEAELRAEINRQALEMAYFIRDQLAIDETMENIVAFLKTNLNEGTPIAKPFRYSTLTPGGS